MQHKILVVDDDVGLVDLISETLKQDGYEVLTANNGAKGFELACQVIPSLVILDLGLPDMPGLEVCNQLRRQRTTATIPIIMLTAKYHEIDKVVGLEVGADDYMSKPFGYRELLARVHALLRRSKHVSSLASSTEEPPTEAASQIIAGPIMIDLTGHQVFCRGQEVPLQPKLFDLLVHFVRNRGTVLKRDELLQTIWGYDYDGGTRTVDVHVRWLREKLEEDPANPQLITTILRVGYCFR